MDFSGLLTGLTRAVRALGWRVRSLFRRPPEEEQVAVQPAVVDLGIISATIYCGCMGLPQELVDQIVDMLHDDLRTLKACSLTCKALFASTRHLIHHTLYLTAQNNQSVLTREEGQELLNRSNCDARLRLVSYMGEHHLLRFAQRVYIRDGRTFTPRNLLPHLHHFQSLDRVHTLTIEHYDAPSWENHYDTCFIHFYPTLTSLTLSHPFSRYKPLLQFALQFPNLENLCLEWLPIKVGHIPDPTAPTLIERSPPLRGHLRLAGYGTTSQEPVDFTRELPNGFNFRTVELEAFFGDRVQHVLDACANTLEDLTIVTLGTGKHLLSLVITKLFAHFFFPTGDIQLRGFRLKETTALCRLTLRMTFREASILRSDALLGVLSTITSLVFSELVLEIGRLPPHFHGSSSEHWGSWEQIDDLLETQFAKYGSFRLVIRTTDLDDKETLERHAKESFPLLAKRGRIHFETSHSTGNHWPL